jgi:hypothetical protein
VDLAAVAAGAAQRLAVDRDRPSPLAWVVTVGEPRAHRGGQASASSHASVRRIVASAGTTHRPVSGSRRVPSAAQTGWGASAAHSAIAVSDRAPGQDRGSGEPEDGGSGCRRPARALGSVTVAR